MAILQTQVTPFGAVPEFFADGAFGFEHGVEAGSASRPARAGLPSSTMRPSSSTSTRSKVSASAISCEMREQRGVAPDFARARQQLVALLEIEPAKRLVENRQAHAGTQQGAAQTHALAFAARDQSAALAERRFQTVREADR